MSDIDSRRKIWSIVEKLANVRTLTVRHCRVQDLGAFSAVIHKWNQLSTIELKSIAIEEIGISLIELPNIKTLRMTAVRRTLRSEDTFGDIGAALGLAFSGVEDVTVRTITMEQAELASGMLAQTNGIRCLHLDLSGWRGSMEAKRANEGTCEAFSSFRL